MYPVFFKHLLCDVARVHSEQDTASSWVLLSVWGDRQVNSSIAVRFYGSTREGLVTRLGTWGLGKVSW